MRRRTVKVEVPQNIHERMLLVDALQEAGDVATRRARSMGDDRQASQEQWRLGDVLHGLAKEIKRAKR